MNMAIKCIPTGLILVICSLFLTGIAGAATPISTIQAGNTVFIGEQGLDITAAMGGDTILGWWASGAAVSSTSPDYTVTVANPASFSVYPSDFASHTGNWYHMSSLTTVGGTAFSVADPTLAIQVEDTTVNVDVTNKWVPTDDALRFRIDTNLYMLTQRTSVASAPITIKVQSPDGGVFTSLVNQPGSSTSLVDYAVTSTPQYTPTIWNTSNRGIYPPGTYTIWAECNVNSMKDNYGQTGKTISSQVSLLNQDKNPLISNGGYVTNPTTAVTTAYTRTTAITTAPATTVITTTTTAAPTTELTTAAPATLSETVAIQTSAPIPAHTTMSPGFGPACALLAILAGIVLLTKKN
jgi:hypothetical protein